jgi:hypothetical protein
VVENKESKLLEEIISIIREQRNFGRVKEIWE